MLLLVGCGDTPPNAADIVQNYESALAEGNYSGACGYLDPRTQAALAHRVSPTATCPQAIARCLPYKATIPKQDQSQLFYANVLATEHGSRASVSLNGNVVADTIREVSLSNERRRGWTLTSYGEGFTACHKHRGKGARHGARA